MANVIKLKRGSGSDPSASDIAVGELAIRTDTGKIFLKKDDGNVAEVSGGGLALTDGDKGDITVSSSGTSWTIDNGAISGAKIADYTITNQDINVSAAIAGTKISPDFGSQNIITTGKGLIGHNLSRDVFQESRLQVSGASIADASISILNVASGTGQSSLILGKRRGSNGALDDGDIIGDITFAGYDGTDLNSRAGIIRSVMTADATSNSLYADLVLYTKRNSGGYPTETVRFKSDGNTTFAGSVSIQGISNSLQVGDVSGDNYAQLQQASVSSGTIRGFTTQYNNASVLENLQGTTNQHIVLGDVNSTSSNTLFGVSHSSSGSYNPRLTLSGSGNLDVHNNITLGGTVDGVDIAARNTLFGGLTSSSGVLTNGVTATTQSASDNSTKVATTAYTDTAISNLVDSSPGTLNTLNELAAALGDDANFSTTVTNSIATKLPLAGGTLSGTLELDGDLWLDASGTASRDVFWDSSESILRFYNSAKATFGNSDALSIFHDGSHSYLANSTGNLYINAPNYFHLGVSNGGDKYITATENGGVELFYDGGKRLETIGSGVIVYGEEGGSGRLNLYADEGDDNADKWRFSASTNGSLYIQNYGSGSWETSIESANNGRVALRHNNVIKLETTSSGTSITGTCSATTFSGSGASLTNVDADTLDGVEGSGYLRSGIADTMSGRLTLSSSSTYPLTIDSSDNAKIVLAGSSSPYIRWRETSTNKAFIAWDTGGFLTLKNQEDGSIIRLKDGIDFSSDNGSTYHSIWTGGNDGSGSGLDADTLDGVQGSSYLRSDADDSFTGDLVSGRDNGIFGSYNSYKTNHIWSMGTAYKNASDGSDFGNLYGLAYKHTNNTTGGTMGGSHQMVWCAAGTPKGAIGNDIWTQGDFKATSSNHIVWHAGNDGSGSGLDADLLDGKQDTQFLRSDAADTAGSDITFSGGAGAVTVAAASDIRIAGGSWTGEYTGGLKIQANSSDSYIQYQGTLYFRATNANNRFQLSQSGAATFDESVTAGTTVHDSKGNLRSIPSNYKSTSYTLVASDAGKYISNNTDITVPSSVFSDGDAITLLNRSGSDITITQGSGLNLYNSADGSTGNRVLGTRGVATILFTASANAYISGAGLS